MTIAGTETGIETGTGTEVPPINLTEAAARRIWELITQDGNSNLKLRVYISGGGCSGFQYGFAFDQVLRPGDIVSHKTVTVEENNLEITVTVDVVVDALSIMYLTGAEIDYVESLRGAHFVVKNPNALTSCSCGSSFSL